MAMAKDGNKKNTKSHIEKKSGFGPQIEQRKLDEANARQAVYDAKSIDEKLQIIATRRGNSTREVARLKAIQEEARKKDPAYISKAIKDKLNSSVNTNKSVK